MWSSVYSCKGVKHFTKYYVNIMYVSCKGVQHFTKLILSVRLCKQQTNRQTIPLEVLNQFFYLMFIAHASIHTFHTRKHPSTYLPHFLSLSLVTWLSFWLVCFSLIFIVQKVEKMFCVFQFVFLIWQAVGYFYLNWAF